MGRGRHLGGAGDKPQLLVVFSWVGVAGIGAGDDLGGAGVRLRAGSRCGARGGWRWGDMCYGERAEHDGVLGHELQ